MGSRMRKQEYTGAGWEIKLFQTELGSLGRKLNKRMRDTEGYGLESLKAYQDIKDVLLRNADLLKTGKAHNKDFHTDNISFKTAWTDVIKKDYQEAFRARDMMEKLLAATGKKLGDPVLMEEYQEMKKVVATFYPPKPNETPEETVKRVHMGGMALNDLIEIKNVYPEFYEMIGSKGIIALIKELRENYESDNPKTLADLVGEYYLEVPVDERNYNSFMRFYKRSLNTHGLYGTTLVNGVYEKKPMKFGNEDIHEYEPYVPYTSVELLDDDDDDDDEWSLY